MFSYIENIYHTIIKKYMELTNCLEKKKIDFQTLAVLLLLYNVNHSWF